MTNMDEFNRLHNEYYTMQVTEHWTLKAVIK